MIIKKNCKIFNICIKAIYVHQTIKITFMKNVSNSNDNYRYPSKYIASVHTNNNPNHNHFIEPSDDVGIISNFDIIIDKHRGEIIHALNSDSFGSISKLINPELYTDGKHIFNFDADLEEDEIPALVDAHPIVNNISITIDTIPTLIKYCFVRNDLELLNILISKSNSDNVTRSLFVTQLAWSHSYHNVIYDPNNHELFKSIITNIKCDDCDADSIIGAITDLKNSNNKIFFLNLMAEYGYYINDDRIRYAITGNNIDVVQYVITQPNGNGKIRVQNIVDKIYLTEISPNGFRMKKSGGCDISMLKFLLDNEIDLRTNAKNIFMGCIGEGFVDSILLLLELFPGEYNLDKAFNYARLHDNISILTLLLKFGADVNNTLEDDTVWDIEFATLKFLIEAGYLPEQSMLDSHLISCFVNDMILDNVNFLIKHGASMNWLEQDKPASIYNDYNQYKQFVAQYGGSWGGVKSPLEFIITSGKMTHIKFVIENYFDLVKPHLNRLFVVACANGQNQIALYLLDYGAELNYRALESACFFGHYETVVMLLKLGMIINQQLTDLFSFVFAGNLNYRHDPNHYNMNEAFQYRTFVGCDDIFRNDIYNFGTVITYVNILKLLISYDLPQSKYHVAYLASMNEEFYDIDIFKYFIIDDIDLNFIKGEVKVDRHTYEYVSLLELSIMYDKLDIIEFLLQKGASGPIENKNILDKIKKSQLVSNILLRYGIEI